MTKFDYEIDNFRRQKTINCLTYLAKCSNIYVTAVKIVVTAISWLRTEFHHKKTRVLSKLWFLLCTFVLVLVVVISFSQYYY